jgi:hypothetical protein
LRPFTSAASILIVHNDELIARSEVTAMLFAVADINRNVAKIVRLLEDEEDGEEEEPEGDEP